MAMAPGKFDAGAQGRGGVVWREIFKYFSSFHSKKF